MNKPCLRRTKGIHYSQNRRGKMNSTDSKEKELQEKCLKLHMREREREERRRMESIESKEDVNVEDSTKQTDAKGQAELATTKDAPPVADLEEQMLEEEKSIGNGVEKSGEEGKEREQSESALNQQDHIEDSKTKEDESKNEPVESEETVEQKSDSQSDSKTKTQQSMKEREEEKNKEQPETHREESKTSEDVEKPEEEEVESREEAGQQSQHVPMKQVEATDRQVEGKEDQENAGGETSNKEEVESNSPQEKKDDPKPSHQDRPQAEQKSTADETPVEEKVTHPTESGEGKDESDETKQPQSPDEEKESQLSESGEIVETPVEEKVTHPTESGEGKDESDETKQPQSSDEEKQSQPSESGEIVETPVEEKVSHPTESREGKGESDETKQSKSPDEEKESQLPESGEIIETPVEEKVTHPTESGEGKDESDETKQPKSRDEEKESQPSESGEMKEAPDETKEVQPTESGEGKDEPKSDGSKQSESIDNVEEGHPPTESVDMQEESKQTDRETAKEEDNDIETKQAESRQQAEELKPTKSQEEKKVSMHSEKEKLVELTHKPDRDFIKGGKVKANTKQEKTANAPQLKNEKKSAATKPKTKTVIVSTESYDYLEIEVEDTNEEDVEKETKDEDVKNKLPEKQHSSLTYFSDPKHNSSSKIRPTPKAGKSTQTEVSNCFQMDSTTLKQLVELVGGSVSRESLDKLSAREFTPESLLQVLQKRHKVAPGIEILLSHAGGMFPAKGQKPIEIVAGGKVFRMLPQLFQRFPKSLLYERLFGRPRPPQTILFNDVDSKCFSLVLEFARTNLRTEHLLMNLSKSEIERLRGNAAKVGMDSYMFPPSSKSFEDRDTAEHLSQPAAKPKNHQVADSFFQQVFLHYEETLFRGGDPVVFRVRPGESLRVEAVQGYGQLLMDVWGKGEEMIAGAVVFHHCEVVSSKQGQWVSLPKSLGRYPGGSDFMYRFYMADSSQPEVISKSASNPFMKIRVSVSVKGFGAQQSTDGTKKAGKFPCGGMEYSKELIEWLGRAKPVQQERSKSGAGQTALNPLKVPRGAKTRTHAKNEIGAMPDSPKPVENKVKSLKDDTSAATYQTIPSPSQQPSQQPAHQYYEGYFQSQPPQQQFVPFQEPHYTQGYYDPTPHQESPYSQGYYDQTQPHQYQFMYPQQDFSSSHTTDQNRVYPYQTSYGGKQQ